MKHCQISWYSRVDFLGQSIAWSRGLAFHVLEWYLYQIDTKVWQWRTIWLNMFGLKVPDCKLIGWCFSKKDKRILEVLFVGHNATTFSTICRGSTTFDPQTAYDELEILGQNLLQICRKGSSKYIPGTQYLAPHTRLSRFSMTPSDWRRNGCFRHQGVALRQRDRWNWRLEICDALEAENGSTHAQVAVFGSLGIQFWDILGINQFWAIPLFGDLGCPFGGRNRGITGRQRSWSFLFLPCRWLGRNGPTWCLQCRGSLVEIHPRNFSWAWAVLPTCPVWILESAILKEEWSFVERWRILTLSTQHSALINVLSNEPLTIQGGRMCFHVHCVMSKIVWVKSKYIKPTPIL